MEVHRHDAHLDVLVLVADQRLDSYEARDEIDGLVRAVDSGARMLIVDCTHVGHVGTFAVCTLLTLHTRMARAGNELRLAAVQPPLRHVLAITRLDQVFHLFASVEEAVTAEDPRLGAANPRTG